MIKPLRLLVLLILRNYQSSSRTLPCLNLIIAHPFQIRYKNPFWRKSQVKNCTLMVSWLLGLLRKKELRFELLFVKTELTDLASKRWRLLRLWAFNKFYLEKDSSALLQSVNANQLPIIIIVQSFLDSTTVLLIEVGLARDVVKGPEGYQDPCRQWNCLPQQYSKERSTHEGVLVIPKYMLHYKSFRTFKSYTQRQMIRREDFVGQALLLPGRVQLQSVHHSHSCGPDVIDLAREFVGDIGRLFIVFIGVKVDVFRLKVLPSFEDSPVYFLRVLWRFSPKQVQDAALWLGVEVPADDSALDMRVVLTIVLEEYGQLLVLDLLLLGVPIEVAAGESEQPLCSPELEQGHDANVELLLLLESLYKLL